MEIDLLTRRQKQGLLIFMDIGIFAVALWLAFALRIGAPDFDSTYFWMLGTIIFARIPAFINLGLYRSFLRYPNERLMLVAAQGLGVSMLVIGMVLYLLDLKGEPRSILFIEPFISFIGVVLSRQTFGQFIFRRASRLRYENVLIYGAGAAGIQMAQSIKVMEGLRVVGFVDDEASKWGMFAAGLEVFPPSKMARLKEKYQIKRVLIAAPSAASTQLKKMVYNLRKSGLEYGQMPDFVDIVRGKVRVEDLFNVQVNDLLGRDIVDPNRELLIKNNSGSVIMVTGAGGSIGSELCRQISTCEPKRLILVDVSEFALYKIDQELKEMFSQVEIIPILGSVLDEARMISVMKEYRVQVVYHAAAYKHVPLVEQNPIEGVKNNVLGTYFTARAAAKTSVSRFVLISTDKAVRPTNVMGASKRMAELVMNLVGHQSLSLEAVNGVLPIPTSFCAVRFGNVLNSAGSVVPLFRQQISEGGPLTVTHKEVSRYFMTIPEASQLVIQAGALSSGGEVFLLDMGEPIRIYDLAQKMIELSQREGRANVEIKITGLRPGEKLYEELLIDPKTSQATPHEKIYKSVEPQHNPKELAEALAEIEKSLDERSTQDIFKVLERVVEGFRTTA